METYKINIINNLKLLKMKKKVLFGVTFALLSGASMVSLQSCKDDLSDFEHQYDIEKNINAMSLKELWDYCKDSGDDSLDGRIKTLKNFMDRLNALDDRGFEEAFKDLRNQVEELNSLKDVVEDLDARVTALENEVEATIDRLDNLITGIIIQRAYGDVFGDFSLPIGVQSNMLFNWYGENVTGIDEFPSSDLDAVAAGITFPTVSSDGIAEGIYNADFYDKINLGTLYMTVNPVGHKFDNTKFTLETSAGNKLPFELNIEGSDYELMFGKTRSADNGFYEASLEVDNTEENVSAIEVKLDEAKLKNAIKTVKNDRSLDAAAKLVKAIYDQINVQVPAYAVRYDWTNTVNNNEYDVEYTYNEQDKKYDRNETVTPEDPATTDNNYAVLSKYELAVATARPLSYNSFKGVGTSVELPTGNIANLIQKLKDKALEKINVDATAEVDGQKVSVKSISFDGEDGLVATVSGLTVGETVVPDFTIDEYEGEALTSDVAVDAINTAIAEKVVEALGKVGDEAIEAEAQLKVNTILLEMNNQINQIVADIKGSVGGAFDSIIGSSYFDRVNKVFALYNKVAGKLNKFLADPNAALQVNALYETADGDLGLLSQKQNDPTQFAAGEATIYLTSNTGEFLAPAYMKFFASTNQTSVNTGDLGKVLPGTTPSVKVTLESGKSYEFVYQALDYSGYTSTKKFYIVVK